MFDIGFSEMIVIALVALVVIGPEKLPKVARTLGHLFARMQRYVNDVKADISREIELDELRKFKNEFESAATSVESSIRAEVNKTESAITDTTKEMTALVEGHPPATAAGHADALPNADAGAAPAATASAPKQPV